MGGGSEYHNWIDQGYPEHIAIGRGILVGAESAVISAFSVDAGLSACGAVSAPKGGLGCLPAGLAAYGVVNHIGNNLANDFNTSIGYGLADIASNGIKAIIEDLPQ